MKHAPIVFFSLWLLSATAVKAQLGPVHFGLKGGINTSEVDFGSNNFSSNNSNGFFAGPTLHVNLPLVGVGFNISALYNQFDTEVNASSFTRRSVDVPLNMRFYTKLAPMVRLYAEGGPQLSFNLGDRVFKFQDNSIGDVSWKINDADVSLNIGAGVTVWKFQVGVNYNIPFGNNGKLTWYDASNNLQSSTSKNRHWQIVGGFYF